MSNNPPLVTVVATALRAARRARGLSIVALAKLGGVSPRLVSEFENGRRSHVSLDTALRLLQLVGVPITLARSTTTASEDEARARTVSAPPEHVGG